MEATIAGVIGAVGAITAAILGVGGVKIANNMRRQIALQITERRLQTYAAHS